MMDHCKTLARNLTPPLVRRLINRCRGGQIRWRGDFPSWTEALSACGGYGDAEILDRVSAAVSQVLDGNAAYERDSVCFPDPAIRFPVLTASLLAASSQPGAAVVDFGGSLGSAWLQHRRFLSPLGVRWRVVEQAAFVAQGKRLFPEGQPSFHETLAEACTGEPPALIILAGVLPYLSDPTAILTEVMRVGPPWILVDRTSVHDRKTDRIAIQEVPPTIYSAAYPCWIFALGRIPEFLRSQYEMVDSYPCHEDFGDPAVRQHGWLFRKIGR